MARVATPLLKRFVCVSCGAMGPMPPRSPFVQCASCATISDFDLGVARRNPDWPRHEAIQHQLYVQAAGAFQRAAEARDQAAYAAVHARILEQLLATCPQVYPKRIAESGYRAHWIAFQSNHQASLVLDPELAAGGRAVGEAVGRIMLAKWTIDTLGPVFDVAVKHFEAQDRIALSRPPGPLPDFARGWMRRIGISLSVQEWLPRLELADQLAFVERMGVASEYVMPGSAKKPRCSGCGTAIDPKEPACSTCRHALDHARGAFDCRSCGVLVHLVAKSERAVCPYCAAEMRESRMGLEKREINRQAFDFIDSELETTIAKSGGAKPIRIDMLDGPVTRRDLPWRMITLRACFANALDHDFFEDTNYVDSVDLEDTIVWPEAYQHVHGVSFRALRVREHPRCLLAPDAAELGRRRDEIDPERTGRIHVVRRGPIGGGCEVWLASGEIVTLATDNEPEARAVKDAATALGWWIAGPPLAE